MLIAALAAGLITIAPEVHPVCEATAYQLLAAVHQGQLTDDKAGEVFRACQINHPPLSPLLPGETR